MWWCWWFILIICSTSSFSREWTEFQKTFITFWPKLFMCFLGHRSKELSIRPERTLCLWQMHHGCALIFCPVWMSLISNVEGTQHIKNSSCEQHTSGCCAVGLCAHLLFACQVVVYDAEKTTSKYHVIVCLTSCVHWGELSTWHSFDAQIIQGETLCIPEKFGGDRKLYVEVLRMCVCACRRSGVTIGGAIESRPHPHPETLYYQSFHQMWCIFQIWFVSVTGNTSVHSSGSYVLKGTLRLFRFIFNHRLCFNQNIREIIYT